MVLTVLAPLVRRSEGKRLRAYQDTGGVWTIGYGHTGPDVFPGLVIDDARAEELLLLDMQEAVIDALLLMPRLATMPAACLAALSDFVFNLGAAQTKTSTLRRRINAGEFEDVPYQLSRWKYDNGVVQPGLVIRRAAEIALWESGLEEFRSTAGTSL